MSRKHRMINSLWVSVLLRMSCTGKCMILPNYHFFWNRLLIKGEIIAPGESYSSWKNFDYFKKKTHISIISPATVVFRSFSSGKYFFSRDVESSFCFFFSQTARHRVLLALPQRCSAPWSMVICFSQYFCHSFIGPLFSHVFPSLRCCAASG